MLERKMGYRGSKSVFFTVKEQRVDGSYAYPALRCTLMDSERNYQVRILSKQIYKRSYCSANTHKPNCINLTPWFFTGICDAESSFSILIQPNPNYSTGWRVKPIFALTLHEKDVAMLRNIQSFLGIGKIHNNGNNRLQFRVDTLEELKVLINHFDMFPLVTAKWADYILFNKAFHIILAKDHLNNNGLLELISIKSMLNLGLSSSLEKAFPNWKQSQCVRPNYTFKGIPDPYWMAGFTSGDGSFNIKISSSPTSLLKKRVQLRFAIGLHIREKDLIKHLGVYFNLINVEKNVYIYKDSIRFEVVNFTDILEKIIPFFDKYKIQGKKAEDYIEFKQAADIIQKKEHLTHKGFEKITAIKANMNKW